MKRKIGPLPLWAWVLIAGGTLGIVAYLRSKPPAVATQQDQFDGSLPATAGAPPDASGGGGGGGTSLDPGSGIGIDDLYAELVGIRGDISTIPGQGLTDQTAAPQTWLGSFTDVTTAIGTLRDTFGISILTPADVEAARKSGASKQKAADKKAAQAAAKKAAAKKKAQGSGGVGALAGGKHDNKPKPPPRRTNQHVANGKTQKRADSSHAVTHQPAKATHINSGGNKQSHRTARPKKH